MRGLWTATTAVVLGMTGPAHADTFCVARPDCPPGGIHVATYAEARAAAVGYDQGHVFLLGAGTFAGPLTVHPGERLAGAGRGKTLVTGGSTVRGHLSDLTLVLDDGSRGGASADDGTLERVDIDGSALTLPGVGVYGFGTTYRHGRIEMAHGIALHSGIEASDLVIDAPTGYVESDYGGSLRRSVVRAERGVVTDGRGLVVEDTALHLRGDAPVGLRTEAPVYPFTGTAHILARNVTIAGPGAGVGVDVEGNCNGGYLGALLDQVAITGFDVHIQRKGVSYDCEGDSDQDADVEVRYSAFDPQRVVSDGSGQLSFDLASPVATELGLIDAAGGDLRPRWDSPLIDAGVVASAADVRGLPRVQAPDVGAYEYQFAPPVAIAAAAALAGTPGAFTFDARASYDVDGDPLTFAWSFDDGESAAGALVEHLFGSGRHEATVRVTDATYRWSDATVVVGEALPTEPTPTPQPTEPTPTPQPMPTPTPAPQASSPATPPVPVARPRQRVRPLRMTIRRRRLGGPGLRYRLRGAIVLPRGTAKRRCAGGHVVVRVPTRRGHDRRRRARVGTACRFTMRISLPRRYRGGSVRLYPQFGGAGGLTPLDGPAVVLRPR